MNKRDAALTKLAIGLASAGAIAGLAGRLAAGTPAPEPPPEPDMARPGWTESAPPPGGFAGNPYLEERDEYWHEDAEFWRAGGYRFAPYLRDGPASERYSFRGRSRPS